MKAMVKRFGRGLKRLDRDQRGADMVEYILIIAAIALPLLAVIIIFRNELWELVRGAWDNIRGEVDVPDS